ncbi:MAG: hypothetical protein V4718_04370 [Pseudomonadota bacterium]
MSRTRPDDLCKLTVAFGDVPEPGDELRFESGRRYFVLRIGGKKTLHCRVMHPDEPNGCRVIPWMWLKRKKKARVLK